jgi:hypothetical protein
MAIGMETPENILVARAQSGSEDGFAELPRKHSSQICKCSLRILQNREDAEHNLQNVLPQHQQFRGQITIFNLTGAGRYKCSGCLRCRTLWSWRCCTRAASTELHKLAHSNKLAA